MSGGEDSIDFPISIPPPKEFTATNPAVASLEEYERLHKQSINDPDTFWSNEANDIDWFKTWDSVLEWDCPRAKWFTNAETNLCYNAVDRHVKNGKGNKIALITETENTEPRSVTYAELKDQVCRVANVLQNSFDVAKSDRVLIYLPCGLEAVISMLACVRIGAIHSVIFGGYSASQIRIRVEESQPKLFITADGTFRRGKVLPLKPVVDNALRGTEIPCMCINLNSGIDYKMNDYDRDWEKTVSKASTEHECASLDSEHPTFILYTSGSTGTPKGILHTLGGYMVAVNSTMKYFMDLKSTDIYWCTADMGWITGHSYVAYGPLVMGGTQLIKEGAYNYPDFRILFELIEKHRISILYTSPTLIRAIMASDTNPAQYHLDSLRLLGTVGEPINPEAWKWFHKQVGGDRCPIVDTWWQTETGCHMIAPMPGAVDNIAGCATRPFFGVDPVILDECGIEVEAGTRGRLYIRRPWPSMLRGIWNRPMIELEQKYFPDGNGMYFAGDFAVKSVEGNITILGRCDDQLNISGHRMGTAELESVIGSHQHISKVAVVPIPDDVTGEAIAAFAVLSSEGIAAEVNRWSLHEAVSKHVTTGYGPHGRPKYLYVVTSLPETKSGKTMRGLLKRVFEISRDVTCPVRRGLEITNLEEKFGTIDIDKKSFRAIVEELTRSMMN